MKMSEPVSNNGASHSRMPRLALLAGGLATRLRPITMTVPKSMVPVAGEPFIAHQLRLLVDQGVREIVMCVGFLGEQLQEFVGDGSAFGCHVEYSFDGDKLKGTGGAIKQALPLLGDHFFIMYGDSYLPTAFAPVYQRFVDSGLQGLMTVYKNENQWDTSNVEFRDGRIIRYHKRERTPEMHYIDYGLGIVRAEVFKRWAADEIFDLALLYEELVEKGQLAGYEVGERFFEIGSHQGLGETDALFLELQRSTRR
jgi:NDP-sugar pyrophosphorylase family protein